MLVVAVAAVGLAGLKFASTAMGTAVHAMTGLVLLAFLVKAAVGVGVGRAFAIGFTLCATAYYVVAYADSATQHRSFSTGAFGTDQALAALYPVVVNHTWINDVTGKVVPNFTPSKPEFQQETRIERDPAVVAAVSAAAATEEPESVGAEAGAGDSFGIVTIAGGRGGGGGIRANDMPLDMQQALNPQQRAEYRAADDTRKTWLRDIFRSEDGRKFIQGGAPLASLKRVYYSRQDSPSHHDFRNVGFCLWTLLVGYAGGNLARFVYSRDGRLQAG
jgi:hypothetical protein